MGLCPSFLHQAQVLLGHPWDGSWNRAATHQPDILRTTGTPILSQTRLKLCGLAGGAYNSGCGFSGQRSFSALERHHEPTPPQPTVACSLYLMQRCWWRCCLCWSGGGVGRLFFPRHMPRPFHLSRSRVGPIFISCPRNLLSRLGDVMCWTSTHSRCALIDIGRQMMAPISSLLLFEKSHTTAS